MRKKLLIFLGLLGLFLTGAPSHAFMGPLDLLVYSSFGKTILVFCVLISLALNIFVFFRGKSKNNEITKSDFYVLFGDYWFDEFYIRRLATFIYFLCCWAFWAVSSFLIVSYLLLVLRASMFVNPWYYFTQYSLALLSSLVFIVFARISIELSIALIKIAENTRKDQIEPSSKNV